MLYFDCKKKAELREWMATQQQQQQQQLQRQQPTLFVDSVPYAHYVNPHKFVVQCLLELHDGSFVSCSFDATTTITATAVTMATTRFSFLALLLDIRLLLCGA